MFECLNCCSFPKKGLTDVSLPEGKTEGTHFDKKKVLEIGLKMAVVSIFIGYCFNQIYVGLVLEIRCFPMVSYKQKSSSTQSAHVNFAEERKYLPCCNIRSPSNKDVELSAGGGKESCLCLVGQR